MKKSGTKKLGTKVFLMKYLKLLIVIPIIICFCSCSVKQKPREIKGDPKLPKETNVVFHFSTQINPRTASKNKLKNGGLSQIHYFNKSGDDIGNFSVNNEMLGDFMVQQDNELIHFFNNFSIKSTNDKYYIIEKESDISLSNIKSGPSEIERIPNKNMSYSLLNAGTSSDRETYITILRIVVGTQSYDIEIPYYICYLAYDEINDNFVLAYNNFEYSGKTPMTSFNYMKIPFDKQQNKYVLKDEIKSIAYTDKIYNNEDYMRYGDFFVKDNIVYKFFTISPKEDLTDKNGDLLSYEESRKEYNDEKRAIQVLLKIDLTTEKMEYKQLTEPFARDDKGYPALVGCADMPVAYKNGTIYYFARNFKVNTYNEKDGFKQRDFKFDFKDINSCTNPYGVSKEVATTDFDDSIVEVDDDGNIYVANIYKDGKLRIHKLNDNDKFELYWESKEKMPKLHKKDMSVNSFEIIN